MFYLVGLPRLAEGLYLRHVPFILKTILIGNLTGLTSAFNLRLFNKLFSFEITLNSNLH